MSGNNVSLITDKLSTTTLYLELHYQSKVFVCNLRAYADNSTDAYMSNKPADSRDSRNYNNSRYF